MCSHFHWEPYENKFTGDLWWSASNTAIFEFGGDVSARTLEKATVLPRLSCRVALFNAHKWAVALNQQIHTCAESHACLWRVGARDLLHQGCLVGEEFQTISFTQMGSADCSFTLWAQVTPRHLSVSASLLVKFRRGPIQLRPLGRWNP